MSRLLTALAFVALAALFFLLPLKAFNDQAVSAYRLLEASSQRTEEKNGHAASFCEQKRENVEKRLWIQKKIPLQMHIFSKSSSLYLFDQKEVTEEMSEVLCQHQEELYYDPNTQTPMQRCQILKAKTASYSYTKNLFIAQEAEIWKYELEGHELLSLKELKTHSPVMHGTAREVEITLKDEDVAVKATALKLTLEPKVPSF